MTQISIDEICPKKEIYPMIVNFQNGYVTDQFTAQDCIVLENSENKCKTIATVIDKLVYAGEEKSEELSKTFILTRNKKTGKVRLIESSVTDMKPILKINEPTPVVLETSNLELSRKFGSKKQKKQMEQREKLKVNVETVTEQMQNVTKTVSKDEIDLSLYDTQNSDDFYIPPINRAAATAEEIYDIDRILTEAQYEKIHSELEGKNYTSDMVPVVKNIVEKKKLSPKLVVLAVYASCLVQMYSSVVKTITAKSFVICPQSVTLNEIILNNFCTVINGRRNRPITYKDRALCHAMVFILLVSGLKIDFAELCETFKLSERNASMKIRVTGASVVTSGSKKTAQLKLPLNTKIPLRRKSTKF
nr:DNA-directed RNA polymerase I subunit RPA49-like [Maniola hyperantus]